MLGTIDGLSTGVSPPVLNVRSTDTPVQINALYPVLVTGSRFLQSSYGAQNPEVNINVTAQLLQTLEQEGDEGAAGPARYCPPSNRPPTLIWNPRFFNLMAWHPMTWPAISARALGRGAHLRALRR
jgi:hypothetical protein